MTNGRLDVRRLDAGRPDAGSIDIRNIEKTERLKSGNMLVQGLSKRVEEQKQILEEEVREKQETKDEAQEVRNTKEVSRDVSRLSEQGKWLGICRDWVLEMEWELWESFLNWFPSEGTSLSEQLDQLSQLYMKLLESILTHTEEGAQQQEQLGRLISVLSEKLNLLTEHSVKDLLEFAEAFGNKDDAINIRSSLYRNVTKEALPGKEAKAFFEKGKMPSQSEGTVLYARSGKGEVQVNKNYRTHVNENRTVFAGRNETWAVKASHGKSGSLYTSKELETADRFVKYIRRNGNLLDSVEHAETALSRTRVKGTQSAAQNEDGMKGVAAAAMDMKAEVFYDSVHTSSGNLSSRSSEKQSGGLFAAVRNMVSRMVDRYLAQAENAQRAASSQSIQRAASNREADHSAENTASGRTPRDVYYYIMNVYRKTGIPEEALAAGIKYAMQQEGWMAGARFISRDWEEFLHVIGQQKEINLVRYMEKYSPWGIFKEEGQQFLGKKGLNKILLLGLTIIIIGVLLSILL